MYIVLEEGQNFLIQVQITEYYLLLPYNILLQPNNGIKNIIRPSMMMRIFPISFNRQRNNTLNLINKIQQNRVILIIRRLIVLIQPDLGGLYKQPQLLIKRHHFPIHLMLLLRANKDDPVKRLQELRLSKNLSDQQRHSPHVDHVRI